YDYFWGGWSLSTRPVSFGSRGAYVMSREQHGGWGTDEGNRRSDVADPPPDPEVLPADPDARRGRFLAEMPRRRRRQPEELRHRQGLVSRLVSAGDLDLAELERQACAGAFPGHWWPRAVRATILDKQGKAQEAEKELADWARAGEDFFPWALLAQFQRHHGRE